MRPSVVWFGEGLPPDIWEKAKSLCECIDCLLVIGTSASVYPAAGLIQSAKNNGAKIIVINTQPSEKNVPVDVELLVPAGKILPALLADLQIVSLKTK